MFRQINPLIDTLRLLVFIKLNNFCGYIPWFSVSFLLLLLPNYFLDSFVFSFKNNLQTAFDLRSLISWFSTFHFN